MDDQQRLTPSDPAAPRDPLETPAPAEPTEPTGPTGVEDLDATQPVPAVPDVAQSAVPPPSPVTEPAATPGQPIATPSSGWVGTTGPADGSEPLPPPPSDTTRSRVGRGLVVVGVIAALFIGSVVIRMAFSNLFTSDHDRAAAEAGQRILDMPEFKARFGDVDSADRAFDIGQELVTSALPRLSPAELDQYWRVTARILDVADQEVCGKILRQTASREEAETAAKSLDIGSWRTLISVTVIAIERELKGIEAPPAPTDAELSDAYVALSDQMGEAEVVSAGNAMNDPSASNTAVCQAGKAFLTGVLALPETPKQTILRFMVSP